MTYLTKSMFERNAEKENPRSPTGSRNYDLPITSSDALPLSYGRLVGARPLNRRQSLPSRSGPVIENHLSSYCFICCLRCYSYPPSGKYMDKMHASHRMGMENQTFMKIAAFCTWLGDFITAWMVTDMMLQVLNRYDSPKRF